MPNIVAGVEISGIVRSAGQQVRQDARVGLTTCLNDVLLLVLVAGDPNLPELSVEELVAALLRYYGALPADRDGLGS